MRGHLQIDTCSSTKAAPSALCKEDQNIVTNPEALVSPPTSWRQLFEDDLYRGKIGLIGLLTEHDRGHRKTYFDGNETLNIVIRAVIEKVGALKEHGGPPRAKWNKLSEVKT